MSTVAPWETEASTVVAPWEAADTKAPWETPPAPPAQPVTSPKPGQSVREYLLELGQKAPAVSPQAQPINTGVSTLTGQPAAPGGFVEPSRTGAVGTAPDLQLVNIPEVQEPTVDQNASQFLKTGVKLATGYEHSMARFVNSMLHPENIAMMVGLAGAPAIVAKAASLGFGAEAAKSVYDQSKEFANETDPTKKAAALTSILLNTAMGAGMLAHGFSREPIAPETEAVAQHVEQAGLPQTADALREQVTADGASGAQAIQSQDAGSTPAPPPVKPVAAPQESPATTEQPTPETQPQPATEAAQPIVQGSEGLPVGTLRHDAFDVNHPVIEGLAPNEQEIASAVEKAQPRIDAGKPFIIPLNKEGFSESPAWIQNNAKFGEPGEKPFVLVENPTGEHTIAGQDHAGHSPEIGGDNVADLLREAQTRGLTIDTSALGEIPSARDVAAAHQEPGGIESGRPVDTGNAEGAGETQSPGANEAPKEVASGIGSEGPGAAASTEFPEQRVTSVKNAVVDEERAARGELPLMAPARKAMGKTWDEAMTRIERNPNEGHELVDDILSGKKKDVSETDHAVLLHEKIRVSNDRAMEADRATDPHATEDDRLEARIRFAALEDRMNDIDHATQQAGTISGRALQIRQQMMHDDYTPAAMERRARAAKGDTPLTPEESATIKAQSDRITELEKKISDLQKKRLEKQGTASADDALKNLKDEADKADSESRRKRQTPNLDAQRKNIIAGIKSRATEGDTPKDLQSLIQKLALNFVRSGVKEREPLVDAVHGVVKEIFPEIERNETRDAISGYGDFKQLDKEPAKVQLRQLKGEMQQIGKIEDMQAKQAPKKTGVERREPSDEERRLIKEVNELKKKGGFVVTDPAKQLKSSLDAIKTRLTNSIRDLEHSIATREPMVSKKGSVPYDAEAEALRSQRDALKGQYDSIFGKAELTDEQRLKMATAAAERSEAMWIDRLENARKGVFDTTTKTRKAVSSAEIEAIKSHIEAIKAEQQELHDLDATVISEKSAKALENRKKAIQSSIDAIVAKLSGTAPAATGAEISRPSHPELEPLMQQRDKLREQLAESRKKPEAQKIEESMQRKLEGLNDSINERLAKLSVGDLSSSGNGKKLNRPLPSKELEQAQQELDAVNKQIADARKAATARSPEAIALKSYKTRTANRIAELQDKLSRGDLSRTVRKPVQFDSEALALKSKAEKLKDDFERSVMKERLKNRTWTEKVGDTLSKWRRGFILSSPVTLAKLTSAAAERMMFTPTEEFIGAGISKVIPKIATKAAREGGLNVRAEASAITNGFTRGMKDSWDILRTGKSELDQVFGKRDSLPREAIDFLGSIHGALKAPAKRNEFARAFEKRAASAISNGIDVSDPLVQTRLATEAYKDSNRSIFMQDNRVVQMWKRGMSALEQPNKETGHVPILSKAGATTLKVLLPIVKVPTNIVAETMQYATGSVTGTARLANAFRKGVDTLHPDQADLIMRELKKGSLGAAVMLLGYLNAQSIGGYYQPGEKRKAGDVKAAGVRIFGADIPSYLVHNPLLETLQIGATIRRVADSKLRKKDTETQGIGVGATAAALGVTQEVPFVHEMLQVSKAYDPRERGAFFGELAKSLVIPQGVQWAASYTDEKNGETVKRKPQTVLQHIETGIPVLRKNVPEKKP